MGSLWDAKRVILSRLVEVLFRLGVSWGDWEIGEVGVEEFEDGFEGDFWGSVGV